MLHKLTLYAALMIAIPAAANEAREVATEAQPQPIELATANPDMRSFFEPKTKSDVNALATLEQDLVSSLSQELSN
jgi:hypothetical protein